MVLMVKNLLANTLDIREVYSIPEFGRFPGGEHGNPLQYFLPGESLGQRILAVCSLWSIKELDATEATQHARKCEGDLLSLI